jgi:hypothetical protein
MLVEASPSAPMLKLKVVAYAGPRFGATARLSESVRPSSSTPIATERAALTAPVRVSVRAKPASPS